MEYFFPYGRKQLSFAISNEANVLTTSIPQTAAISSFSSKVLYLLAHPTTGPSLQELIDRKQNQSIAIIVNDATRSTPTRKVLEVLLPYFHKGGIQKSQIVIVIATGTHRQATDTEINTIVGHSIAQQYQIVCHDCDAVNLVSVGKLSSGAELKLNPHVANANLRISIGEILYHYYAGFSGGRKSIFPGVADRQSIQSNHEKMLHTSSRMGCLEGNPVHEELMDSLRLCPLDFCIHLIGDSNQQIFDIVTGDPVESWKLGIQIFQRCNQIKIPQKADHLIVSAGGYPKDINMYQAHKALEMSSKAVKNGGHILFISECSEKWGHPVFEEYVKKRMNLDQICQEMRDGFVFGLHKLYCIAQLRKRFRLFLYSSFTEDETHLLYMEKVNHIQKYIHNIHPSHAICLLPQGSIGIPVIQE